MAKVRDLNKAAERFQRRAGGAQAEYVDGVNDNTDWEANTANAEQNYAQGVAAAATKKSFSKGVKRAGQQKYKDGATKKGAGRYVEGVMQAGPDWQKGFEPYKAVIEGTNLPPRGPRGSAGNFERSKAVGMALAKKKESLKGS